MRIVYIILALFLFSNEALIAQVKDRPLSNNSEPTYVHLGYYVNSIRDIELNKGTFYADFYLWVRFHTTSEQKKKAILEKMEFMNVKDRKELSEMVNDQWQKGNEYYTSWRIQGEFFFEPELKNYPFDSQTLTLPIENAQFDAEGLIFLSDIQSYKRSEMPQKYWGTDIGLTSLPYKFLGTDLKVQDHTYSSDFGNLKVNEKSVFSRSTLNLYFQRDYWGYVLKVLLPLMIIVGMSYVVFFISPVEVTATSGISVTSLLSCLALNFVIAQTLPSVGYLIKNDYFFLLSYLLILLSLASSVFSFNLMKNGRIATAERWKKMGRLIFPILYFVCFAYFIIRHI